MRPEAVEYVLDNLESAFIKSLGRLRRGISTDEQAQGRVGARGCQSDPGCGAGRFFTRTSGRSRHARAKISDISAKLLESRPDSLRIKLRNIRSFVVHHMRDVRELVNSETARTRALFAKHIERITLTPTGEHYVASGTWDFIGRGSIDGAGGPVCTVRATEFSLPVAA